MTDALQFVDLTPDQLEAVIRIRSRSFGHLSEASREEWLRDAHDFIADGRMYGVTLGDELVAAARVWDFTQWWAGRAVPMAGVAGVVVAPEHRGRGVGSRLMRGVLERSRAKGFALSALYPATVPVYRRLGYEFGGCRYKFSFPAADVRLLGGKEVELRQAGEDDAGRFLELVGQDRARTRASGPLGWPEPQVREWLGDDELFAYQADDGFVAYTWDGSDLRVDELIAGSEATARALWATVGSGSSIARTVHAYGAPQDPLHLLLDHEAERNVEVQRWMLRLLDAPAAIAGRGWPEAVAAEVDLDLDDPELPGNAGRWHLSVDGGTGRLVRSDGSGPAVRLGARGMAALYAGTPVGSLRVAGLATGGSAEDDARLNAAFATSTPYMLDYF